MTYFFYRCLGNKWYAYEHSLTLMLQWLVEHQWRIQRVQQVQRHLPEKTPNNGFLPITHTTEDAIEGLHKSSPLHLI